MFDSRWTHNIDANVCRRIVVEYQSKHAQDTIPSERKGKAQTIQYCLHGSVVWGEHSYVQMILQVVSSLWQRRQQLSLER